MNVIQTKSSLFNKAYMRTTVLLHLQMAVSSARSRDRSNSITILIVVAAVRTTNNTLVNYCLIMSAAFSIK